MRYAALTFIVLFTAVLCVATAVAQIPGSITVDSVVGSLGADKLVTGAEIAFRLRYVNLSDHSWNVSNGFVIYSPDGALWSGPVHGDTVAGAMPASSFDLQFAINAFSGTGLPRRDTVGIFGAAVYGEGLPSGFNGVPYSVTIGSLDPRDAGKHICVDTCWFRPGGSWKWADSGGVTASAAWGGPYCFTIVCCTGDRGNVDGDTEDKVNVSDVAYLIGYLFGIPPGPEPPCREMGNVNGDPDEKVNVSDVAYLLGYLFGIPTGPAPKPCP